MMTQFSALTKEILHVDEISLWWGHSVETAKVETKGQNGTVVAGWDEISDLHGRDNVCPFIMLYLIPLKTCMPTNIPTLKTTGLRGSNVWHKSGISEDYAIDLIHNKHYQTHKQIAAQFHPNLRPPSLIEMVERKSSRRSSKIQHTSNVLRENFNSI